MKGTASSSSNHSATASSSTEGANGRNDSRRLILALRMRLHVGAARIADDRAVAERARAPFHAALKPADDLAVGDRRGRAPAQLCLVGDRFDRAAGRRRSRSPCCDQQPRDLARAELRPPIGVVHHERARAAELVPDARRPRRSRRRHRRPPPAHRRAGTASSAAPCRWRPSSSRSRRPAPGRSSP